MQTILASSLLIILSLINSLFGNTGKNIYTKKNNSNTAETITYPNNNGHKAVFWKQETVAGGNISVNPLKIYDNDVAGGSAGINRKITVKNTGAGVLSLSSVSLTGANPTQFLLTGLPVFPKNINAGDSISFSVAFNPSSAGLKTATIAINSDASSNPAVSVLLRGLGVAGNGSVNEPSLQALLNLLEIEANVGDDSVSTPLINTNVALQKAQLLGDEISLQKFVKAGAGAVTITPLAVFGPTDSSTIVGMGWYKSGRPATGSELFTVHNSPTSNGQTVNVKFTGALSFDPATDTFGFFSHWPHFNDRYIYSEDNLNTFSGSVPHHVRVYPYRKNGTLIPNTYLVTFEETTSKLDYNDLIFLVSNVKKVQSNASLFIENLDKFPSNDQFVFSRVQTPWSRDSINYNSNHDSLKVRVRNNGIGQLIISNLTLSNDTTWKILKLNSATYVPGAGLPVTINSGAFLDVTLKFIATNQASRIKVLHEKLTIASNDDKYPLKIVSLNGLWQKFGEGSDEPYAQEIINVFGFKTQTGFGHTDPDLGDSTKLKGSEVKPSFFVRADPSLPVSIRQMSAYHGCCTSTEKITWYAKGSSTQNTVVTHIAQDGQSVLPRKSTSGTPASGTFNPTTPFGFMVGYVDVTDAAKNPGKKIGIRVWKAIDANGSVIPNSYIVSNDYLGTTSTNYDYNDNTYFISNIKPEAGTAYFSTLSSTPSALDFGENVLHSSDSLQLNLKSLGKLYPNGSADPAINISSIEITGENNAEFSADMPLSSTLNPQETTTIKIRFNPLSQGLKIADLLIRYDNSASPLRVPLYGIARSADSIVVVNNRIKSGSSSPITVNGKLWSSDASYAFDNLEPYTNPNISQIAATDEDSLYLTEQSSNADKKPFRYEIPVPNGNYVLRLHFSEIYWGTPGGGSGGAGSRVMSVKLENQLQLINFDIAGEVNSASAIIRNFPVTVTDGKLNIDFSATVNRPSLSAVEVYSFVAAGPLATDDFFNLKGSAKDNSIELNWVNTNEAGTEHYEVERSTNNLDFITLGRVSSGSSQYSFTDNAPAINDNFYRIKKVSTDGRFDYSRIIRIGFSRIFGMRLFPNPGTDKVSVQFSGVTNEEATITLQTLSGSTVKTIPVILSGQKIDIDISSLSAGVYILRVSTSTKNINEKFFKK